MTTIQLNHVSSYGSRYYDVFDEDGCHALIRVANHAQKDHNRSEFGGVNYNLYNQQFSNDAELEAALDSLIKRTHEKKYAKLKPKSKWLKPEMALREYHLTALPNNLIWYKRASPTRAAILRESLEKALESKQ